MGIDWTERMEPVPGAVMGRVRMMMMIRMVMRRRRIMMSKITGMGEDDAIFLWL